MCCWMGETFSWNELCSFWVTCCVLLKEAPCLNGAGLEFAGLLGSRGAAGAGQWSENLDQEHRLVVFSSYRLLFQVLQPRGMLQHPGYEKCQGRSCLWNTLHFIYLLLLRQKKKFLRLMVLNRKYIFCFKTAQSLLTGPLYSSATAFTPNWVWMKVQFWHQRCSRSRFL